MSPDSGPHVLIMGVCGTGKSSAAGRLVAVTGAVLIEADAYHPAANIAQMAAGSPLTDAQRWPWLDAVAAAVAAQSGTVVIACSALKRRYRDRLRASLGPLVLVHLTGEPALIRARLEARRGHFMSPDLLESQLAELEPPGADEHSLRLDVALTPDEQDAQIMAYLASIRKGGSDELLR
jgi:gluconokinase